MTISRFLPVRLQANAKAASIRGKPGQIKKRPGGVCPGRFFQVRLTLFKTRFWLITVNQFVNSLLNNQK